ncbi:MAG: hypothetical protein GY716_16600 [bacterium]|nr:hypothetical protein [bacterium]
MGRKSLTGCTRLALGLVLVAGCVAALHAAPADKAAEVRDAIDDIRQLHDGLQAALSAGDDDTAAQPANRHARNGNKTDVNARRSDVQTSTVSVNVGDRARLHAERSLQHVTRRLTLAERVVERSPEYAQHHVGVARRELDKAARRMGVSLEEVQ